YPEEGSPERYPEEGSPERYPEEGSPERYPEEGSPERYPEEGSPERRRLAEQQQQQHRQRPFQEIDGQDGLLRELLSEAGRVGVEGFRGDGGVDGGGDAALDGGGDLGHAWRGVMVGRKGERGAGSDNSGSVGGAGPSTRKERLDATKRAGTGRSGVCSATGCVFFGGIGGVDSRGGSAGRTADIA
ncbi:unnamed protein product, partial [Ectocarpus fasciculatus]